MSFPGVLENIDRVSMSNLMTGKKSSWIGLVGTVMIVALCLGFFIPPVISYFEGNYYQSQYLTFANQTGMAYSKDDFKMAIVIKNKFTGSVYDHSQIMNVLTAMVVSYTSANINFQPLVGCDPNYFAGDINGFVMEDCLMIPDQIELDLSTERSWPFLTMQISVPYQYVPFPRINVQLTDAQQFYNDLASSSYIEFYFTSRVVTPSNQVKFQVHRIYSTEYQNRGTDLWATMTVTQGTRFTMMDDSIMPWRNNRNVSTLNWRGNQMYQNTLGIVGIQMDTSQEVAVRYYKKLDWLLAIIGGGIFLFFVVFWHVFNYINLQFLRAELPSKFFIKKLSEQLPRNGDDLYQVKISRWFFLRNLWPFCKDKQSKTLIDNAENENDIVLTISRLKVAVRNLQKQKMMVPFRPRFIQFPGDDAARLNQNQSDIDGSQSNPGQGKIEEKRNIQDDSRQFFIEGEIEKRNPRQNIYPEVAQPDHSDSHSRIKKHDQSFSEAEDSQFDQPPPAPVSVSIPKQAENAQFNGQFPITETPQIQNNIITIHGQGQVVIQPNGSQASNRIIDMNDELVRKGRDEQQSHDSNPQNVEQIIFAQSRPIDGIFGLTNEQFRGVTQNKSVGKIYDNNATVAVLREEKPVDYLQMMKIDQQDKYDGHYPKRSKLKHRVRQLIASLFKWLDIFWVRIQLVPRGGSFCGIFVTLIIILLSALTFALTISNMKSFQYKVDQQFLGVNDVSFTSVTNEKLNLVLCVSDTTYLVGSSASITLNFFTVKNGVTTNFAPVQMNYGDTTFNINNNQYFPYDVTYCFRMAYNIPITLNSNSYFGYTLTSYCSGTNSYCSTIGNTKFINQMNNIQTRTFMPSNVIDFNSTSLIPGVSDVVSNSVGKISFTTNSKITQTTFAEVAQIRNNAGNQFMHGDSQLTEQQINVNTQTSKINIRAWKANNPSYTFRLKPSQSRTVFTLEQKKIDFILGIIGGVFVFWYAVIRFIGHIYNRFNFNLVVAKELYDEQVFDQCFTTKLAAALRTPLWLVPNFFGLRADIARMRGLNQKIDKSLNHLAVVKYTDIVYQLSGQFFREKNALKNMSLKDMSLRNKSLKNMSQLYLKEKINEAATTGVIEQENTGQNQFKQLQDKIPFEKKGDNQVMNETKFTLNMEETKRQIAAEGDAPQKIDVQKYNQNIIEDNSNNSTIPDLFDMFYQPASFAFKKERRMGSCFGGVLCLIMVALIAIVVNYSVILYFTAAGQTVSYQTVIDDIQAGDGITLTTGVNFKLGASAINLISMVPSNITSYISSTVGISILSTIDSKTNGLLTTSTSQIDLIPCPANYLYSWMPPLADPPTDNFTYAYCVPDGVTFYLKGLPTDQIHQYFKLSIYDKSGTAGGYSTMSWLLGNYTFEIYYTSPQVNEVGRHMQYFVYSTILDMPSKTNTIRAIQRNMTLSKLNITYDDSTSWQSNPLNTIGYEYDKFITQKMYYQHLGANPTTNLWYNVSFAYSKRILTYDVQRPKFYEVWGLVGGVIAVFYFVFNCLGSSFNNYNMKYLIGRELYSFEKLKDNRKARKRRVDSQLIQSINNFSEFDILKAYLLSFIGKILRNNNFNDLLRRVTLIQEKVQKDMDLIDFYKRLYNAREIIKKQLQKDNQDLKDTKITDIYLKKIFNMDPYKYNFLPQLNLAKKNNLSSYHQRIVAQANSTRINFREVFDNVFLARTFGLEDGNESVRLQNFPQTEGSINTSSFGGSVGSVGELSVVDS